MRSRRNLCLLAAAVVFSGSAYLATPAAAESAFECSEQEWNEAAQRTEEACEGGGSFWGRCENGEFIIEGIECY